MNNIMTWNFPEVSTITPAFRAGGVNTMLAGTIATMDDVNDMMGALVVYAVIRFVLTSSKLPEMLTKVLDYAFASVILWNVFEIVLQVMEQTQRVMGGIR